MLIYAEFSRWCPPGHIVVAVLALACRLCSSSAHAQSHISDLDSLPYSLLTPTQNFGPYLLSYSLLVSLTHTYTRTLYLYFCSRLQADLHSIPTLTLSAYRFCFRYSRALSPTRSYAHAQACASPSCWCVLLRPIILNSSHALHYLLLSARARNPLLPNTGTKFCSGDRRLLKGLLCTMQSSTSVSRSKDHAGSVPLAARH